MEKAKKISDSEIEMVQLVLPNDVNLLNNLKGGQLMHWIDIAAALTASKHSEKYVATVAIDSLYFRHPIRRGEMVKLQARLVSVGKTSMRIKVTVWAENLQTGAVIKTNEANLVFVALDETGRPTRVPEISE
ncbi:MAG: acyl-CoA thioesterase [Clostridia bacterium]|nr:acyl-CoA thioesterase [Clostridia bacterium]